jgi:hypothetical protein
VLDLRVSIPDYIVSRAFPNETVILNLESGKYHGLNPTSGRMLEALRRTSRPREAAVQLSQEMDQPLERISTDLADLIVELQRRGLVKVEDRDDGA